MGSCLLGSFSGVMRILSQGHIMCDDVGTDSSLLMVVKKTLALISIEREFLSVDVKNEVVQVFSNRRAHLGKTN